MKKVLVVAAAAVTGVLAWRKVQAGQAEQDLWAEATDEVR